jgi:hypothetical protein
MHQKFDSKYGHCYDFQIYYSKDYKLYDLVISKSGDFDSHYHLSNKEEINKIINKYLNNLK